MKRSKKLAILAALTMGVQFGSHASASDTDYAYYNGVKFAEFEYFNEGEFASEYTLSDFLRNATKSATSYWSEMLGHRSKAPSAWVIVQQHAPQMASLALPENASRRATITFVPCFFCSAYE